MQNLYLQDKSKKIFSQKGRKYTSTAGRVISFSEIMLKVSAEIFITLIICAALAFINIKFL